MKKLAKIFAVVIMVTGFAPAAIADDANKESLAFSLTSMFAKDFNDEHNMLITNGVEHMRQSGKYCFTEANKNKFIKLQSDFYAKSVSARQKILHDFFINNFSEAELVDLNNFYASPAGSKFHDKLINTFMPQYYAEYYNQDYDAFTKEYQSVLNEFRYSNGTCNTQQ